MKHFIFSAFVFALFIAAPVFAAGGGGGGGSGTVSTPIICTKDTWTCGEWGPCLLSGVRQRACMLADDCPSVVAPKPETTEACILPMTAPTPAPAPKPAPAPVPAAAAQWKLKCFHLKTLRARIDCRLALPHDQLEKEIAAKYLPEECRSKPVKQQAACVQLYKNFGPCWDREGVSPRMECAREVIGMSSENIVDLYRECKDLKSKEKTACLATQREKLFVYAKFKFYDLSEYAEEYLEDGIVTRKAAVDFVTQMETKKQQFNKAGNNFARRLAIAKEVRATWGAFMKKVNLGAVAGDPVARAELYQAMDVEMGQTLAQLLDLK